MSNKCLSNMHICWKCPRWKSRMWTLLLNYVIQQSCSLRKSTDNLKCFECPAKSQEQVLILGFNYLCIWLMYSSNSWCMNVDSKKSDCRNAAKCSSHPPPLFWFIWNGWYITHFNSNADKYFCCFCKALLHWHFCPHTCMYTHNKAILQIT